MAGLKDSELLGYVIVTDLEPPVRELGRVTWSGVTHTMSAGTGEVRLYIASMTVHVNVILYPSNTISCGVDILALIRVLATKIEQERIKVSELRSVFNIREHNAKYMKKYTLICKMLNISYTYHPIERILMRS